jgi:hypothetical protein
MKIISFLLLAMASVYSLADDLETNTENSYIEKINKMGISSAPSHKIIEIVNLIKSEVALVIAKSVSKNKEFGGVIYEEGGIIKSTRSKSESSCEINCFIDLSGDYNSLLPKVRSGAVTIYTEWHTHPRSNYVSDGDMDGINQVHKFLSKYDSNFMGGFYSTPSSAIYLVAPGFTSSRKASKDAILVGKAVSVDLAAN